MSEPASKRQPLIDLYEFERRMRAALPEGAPAGEAAEAAQADAMIADAPVADEVISAPTAAIGGDFAEIEAALLRAAEARSADPEALLFPDLRASRDDDADDAFDAEPFDAKPFAATPQGRDEDLPGLGLAPFLKPDAFDGLVLPKPAPDHFIFVDDDALAGGGGLFEEEKRSRRPLYVMAAVALAGAAGLIATSTFRHSPADAPALVETASVAAPIAPAPAAEPAAAPAHFAAAEPNRSATPDEAPAAAAALAASGLLAPPPYGAPGAHPVAATPDLPEPKLVKTAVVRPDGALAKPHVASLAAADHAAEPAARVDSTARVDSAKPDPAKSHAPALAADAAKAEAAKPAVAAKAAPKAAAKTAAVLPPQRPAAEPGDKPAAEKPIRAARARDAAKPKPAQAPEPAQDLAAAQPAPAPEAPPAPKPSPLAFVDTAVSSITGATTKIIDWGRSAANLAHN